MKKLMVTLLLTTSVFAAEDFCSPWRNNERYNRAINSLATYLEYDVNEMCSLPSVLNIEAQPARTIDRNGNYIPHVRVTFHKAYESCYYMVRDEDQVVTDGRCYSTY